MMNEADSEWQAALAWASNTRASFASIVDRVRAGELDLDGAHTEADADPITGRVFAVKVYEVSPGIGKVRSRRTMAALGLADDVTLAEVPTATRAEIIAAFAEDPVGR